MISRGHFTQVSGPRGLVMIRWVYSLSYRATSVLNMVQTKKLRSSCSNLSIFESYRKTLLTAPKNSIVCYFHTLSAANSTTAVAGTAYSPSKLQYELITSSKCGEFDKALKILETLKSLKHPIHSNIYCALLNHATKHRKEDVFNTILDYIDENRIPYDVQLYTVKTVGNLKFYGFEKAMPVLDEMIAKEFTPRKELLNLLFEDCLQRSDTKNCVFFYFLYLERSILPPLNLLTNFITVCLNEKLHHCIMKLLQFCAMQNTALDENLVYHLKVYFDSSPDERNNPSWSTSFATIDKRACSNCRWQLPSSLLSEDEVIKLRLHVTDMISRKVASLSSSRHEMFEIRNLNELICSKLPIHYVMDGANVGYIGDQTFSFDKILKVSRMVMKTKDSKMLVIGTQQLFQSINIIDGHRATEAEAMKHYANQGIYFFLKFYRVPDDYYLMYAALSCSFRTMFITNDRLLDHINTLGLEGEMGALFRRWQLSRQIRIHNDKCGEIDGLIFPKMYETKVYLKEGHYHIPIQDSSKWLCVKKIRHNQCFVI